MKKIIAYFMILVLALSFAGCGQSDKYSGATAPADYDEKGFNTNGGAEVSGATADYDVAAESEYSEDYQDETAKNSEIDVNSTVKAKAAGSQSSLNKDMLVYRGNLTLESVNFDKSLDMIKAMIKDYDAFTQSENLQMNEYAKYRTYTASIRVASSKYEDFMDAASNAEATVTSKNSNAENVSQEYSDTAKALEIYEAKEARYIEQIKTIKDEKALIQLEDSLTDLQVTIAQLKTRKSQIETDVAYSYVNITLTEVKVIEEGKESTFKDRLKATLSESGQNFLNFLEGLLFLLIRCLPELIVIFLIVFAIVKFVIFIKRRKKAKKEKKDKALSEESSTKDSANADNNHK